MEQELMVTRESMLNQHMTFSTHKCKVMHSENSSYFIHPMMNSELNIIMEE